jgi:hypothetical protein
MMFTIPERSITDDEWTIFISGFESDLCQGRLFIPALISPKRIEKV